MRLMTGFLTSLISASVTAALAAGCTVYKSSDRDDFNSNGKARAPKTTALSLDDQELLLNPCSAFTTVPARELDRLFGPSRLGFVKQVSTKTSTCLVRAIPLTSPDSKSLDTVSVLSCSWKPVSGEPINVDRDRLAIQTTEDDLRDHGLSVVQTTVTGGQTLRMNCEAYVPTPALTDRTREDDVDALALRVTEFSHALNRQTLVTTPQD